MSVGLCQSVSIPATTPSAMLSFALHIETKEISTGIASDTFVVQIRNSSGTILKTLATYSNLNAALGSKVYNFDLAAYKGQTIQLYFLGAEDSSIATSFMLDKINLIGAEGGAGDNQAPVISASESGGSDTISFSATATDNVSATKVEIYEDGLLTGTDTTAPYSMTMDSRTLSNGSHKLTSKTYDAAGNMGASAPVTFVINNAATDTDPPIVSVSESGDSGAITFNATATDNIGVIKLEFYVDGVLKGTDATSPYSMVIDSLTLSNGAHTLNR